jgi:SAM-dependent methyltransferase
MESEQKKLYLSGEAETALYWLRKTLGVDSPDMSSEEIRDFNQKQRDIWVQEKARMVELGSRVLDIGAGTCRYRHLFSHCDYKTHDFKKLETEYGKIDYESDLVEIPVESASFDTVLCTEVLEHVPEPILAVHEMSRILKPSGRLILTAPLNAGLHQEPYHFYGGFTPHWYWHFLLKAGFSDIEVWANGGFFSFLAQENGRMAWNLPYHEDLHGNNTAFVYLLFGEVLPRYLLSMEEKMVLGGLTVGYHVTATKGAMRE